VKKLLLTALLALLTTACATDDAETIVVAADEDDGTDGNVADDKSDAVSEFHVVDVALPFDEVADESFLVFTSRSSFNNFYGINSGLDVDFRYQWVFVYQAGSQPTGGYIPGILDITRRSGDRIRFQTQLATPGNGCLTTQAVSRPYVVVAFRKPTRPNAARFSVLHGEIVNDCEPTSCELVDCLPDMWCDDSSGTAQCVPVEPVSCAATLCMTQTYCDESTGTAQCLPLVCPAPGTVFNCKLPLTPDRGPSCNPTFRDWVGGNCPDVTFAL
jgi:hypothetical protein